MALYDRQEGNLVNIATDGEIYGHHEPFGDMCLAALTKKISKRDDIRFTNYSEYLSLFPPEQEVRLRKGEAEKGTSWSCSHGVSRWYKDCGCHTGGREGWNQKWRTPLREAFDFLNETLTGIYIREAADLSDKDPFIIRNDYIRVITGTETAEDFCGQYLRRDNAENRTKFLKLLEGQKYILYTFTSCGWFFSEISGLEPVQNMKYAAKAIQLYDPSLAREHTEHFLKILAKAESNLKEQGNGKIIYSRYTDRSENLISDIAGIFLILDQLHIAYGHHGLFRNIGITFKPGTDEPQLKRTGTIQIRETETERILNVDFKMESEEGTFFPELWLKSSGEKYIRFKPESLPLKIKNMVAERYPRMLDSSGISMLLNMVQQGLDLSTIRMVSTEFPETIMAETLSLFLNFSILCALLNIQKKKETEKNFSQLKELLYCSNSGQLWKKETLNRICQDILASRIEEFFNSPDKNLYQFIMDFLKLIHKSGLDPIKPAVQERIFEIDKNINFKKNTNVKTT